MKELSNEELQQLSQMYAFLGNSLLRPMNQTKGPGLDPTFWASLPDFDDTSVGAALDALCSFAERARMESEGGGDPLTEVAVEHTRLFVGPPSPAAAPWETYYPDTPEGIAVQEPTSGFGEPTFAMRTLLRQAGLQLANESRQFEDHIGIELLFLSELLSRAVTGDAEALSASKSFIEEHPGRWMGRLIAKVSENYPDGYIIRLLALADALLML